MTANSDRFTGRVEVYERYRTRFPRAVVERLKQNCGLVETDVVADVGAGTGMLGELFLENGNRVIAVEPNAEMRAACERLGQRFPALEIVDAAAESTGLEAGSVDFVTVGRAFHWFDKRRALAEFRRILRGAESGREGWVVLVTSHWGGDGSAQSVDFEEILLRDGIDYGEVHAQKVKEEDVRRIFRAEGLVHELMSSEQEERVEEFFGRAQSLSVVPDVGHAKYEAMQRSLREHFARYAVGGVIRVKPTYWFTCGRIAGEQGRG